MVKKRLGDHEVVTFKCSKKLLEHLKKITISIIRQNGTMYTLSDLIRDTLLQIYPPPKQLDFTGDKDSL